MVENGLEKAEVRKIDNDTVEFKATCLYTDSWRRVYEVYDIMTGLRLVPTALETKRLDMEVTEVVRTYRLRTGYYALLELREVKTGIRNSQAIFLATTPIGYIITEYNWKTMYAILPLIVRNGMVFTVDELAIEGEASQTDEAYKAVENIISKWKNELPKYGAKPT